MWSKYAGLKRTTWGFESRASMEDQEMMIFDMHAVM
jgi:branched-subunit amino acid ABC-type transport system permease component